MAGNSLVAMFKIAELRKRLLFTFGMLLVVRLGSILPLVGVDVSAVKAFYASQPGAMSGITDYLNFFSGGAYKNTAIFMLSVFPYISAQILMQVSMLIFPKLKQLSEDDGGRRKIQLYTRYATVFIAILQGFAQLSLLRQMDSMVAGGVITMESTTGFIALSLATMAVGTLVLVWIGEQITQRGVGNGVSLIIFAGIVARFPSAIAILIQSMDTNSANPVNPVFAVLIFILFLVIIALVIYEQQGQRKIPVNYAKRVVGRKMYGGTSSYIPFKINPSGVIPVIFASAVLQFPLLLASSVQIGWLNRFAMWMRPQGAPYIIIYTLLIVFFAYFYTQVTLNPIEIAKQIRENGGSIPGIRAEKTEEYLTRVLSRIVLPGALFLAFIAITPTLLQMVFGFPQEVTTLLGGTSVLIMVGVDLDFISQIEGHLKMHHQGGLVKKGKIQSRKL